MLVAKFTTGNLMGVLMEHLHAPVLAIKRKYLHIQYIQLYIQPLLCHDCLLNMYKWKIKWGKLDSFKVWTFLKRHLQTVFRPPHIWAEIYKVLPFIFQFCFNKCYYKVFRLVIKKLLMCFLHANQFNMGIVMLTLLYITAFIISHSSNIKNKQKAFGFLIDSFLSQSESCVRFVASDS